MALKPVLGTDPVSNDAVKALSPSAPVSSLAARVDSVAAPSTETAAKKPLSKGAANRKADELTVQLTASQARVAVLERQLASLGAITLLQQEEKGQLTASQARVAVLEKQLASIGATTLLQHVEKATEKQQSAKGLLKEIMTRLSAAALDPTSSRKPITAELATYSARFQGFSAEVKELAERVGGMDVVRPEIVKKEYQLERGAKLEDFIVLAKSLLEAKPQDNGWKKEVAKLQQLFANLKSDHVLEIFFLNENLVAKKMAKAWNEGLHAYYQIEMVLQKQQAESLQAASLGLKQEIQEKTKAVAKDVVELQKKPFELRAYFTLLETQFKLVVKLCATKESFSSSVKEFGGTVTTVSNDLYYFQTSEKVKLYQGNVDEVKTNHQASLSKHKKEMEQMKASLEKAPQEITALLDTFGSILDRIYEAANNDGTPISGAAWLISGSNTCKHACTYGSSYINLLNPLLETLRAKLLTEKTTAALAASVLK